MDQRETSSVGQTHNYSVFNSILKNENTILLLIIIYLIMLGLNFLTPMLFGDDYVYSFIWQPNQVMSSPLPETAKRLTSFTDILVSQWNHYFSWGGRTVAHIFVQFFAWQGKEIFNFFNSLMFTILILQISWISNEGRISVTSIRPNIILLTFFIFWAFTVGFHAVYLWMTGACNYVWTMVILLFFLIPYVKHYYSPENKTYDNQVFKYFNFFFGIIAGWTNENTACWLICLLGVWLFKRNRNSNLKKWMLYGYVGLCIGYVFLIFAPGNAVRSALITGNTLVFMEWKYLRGRLLVFFAIEFFQVFIWFFIIKSFRKLTLITDSSCFGKHLQLAKLFCVVSLLSNVIMIFVPDFQPRSGFPSLIFVSIALALVLRVHYLTRVSFIPNIAKKFITIICGIYFMVTMAATFMLTYDVFSYTESVKYEINRKRYQDIIYLPASPQVSNLLWYASGLHLLENGLDEKVDGFRNVALSRYYGVKRVDRQN